MKKSIYIFLLLLFSQSVFPNKGLIVQDYSIENGLPHNTVYSSLKDKDGFMWFGTWYGLASFDGLKFKSYNKRDDYNTDIPPHKIQIILEAKDGNLWIKTIDHKLFLFDKKYELFYDVFNEIKKKYSVSPKIIKIQKTDSGELLLLTKNRDLLKAESKGNGKIEIKLLYDSQSTREHRLTNNLLLEDAKYINWIGLDFKIISCEKGTALNGKPSDFVLRKLVNGQNQEFTCANKYDNILWVGDNHGNVFKIDYGKGSFKKIDLFNGMGAIQDVTCLNGKNVFVSIENKGIIEYDEKTNNSIKVLPLLPGESITNTFIDSYDKVWFELNQSKVIYFDPFNRSSKRFDFPAGRINKEIKYQDGKEFGMFFLSTSGDLVWFDRSRLSITLLNSQADLMQKGEKNYYFVKYMTKI